MRRRYRLLIAVLAAFAFLLPGTVAARAKTPPTVARKAKKIKRHKAAKIKLYKAPKVNRKSNRIR